MTPPPHPHSPPPEPELPPELCWWQRLNALNVTLILFAILVVSSLPVLQGSGRDLSFWEQLARFLRRFFPPDLSVLPATMVALWETIRIAAVATFFGVILSLFAAFAAARRLAPIGVVYVARFILNSIRTIPSLIWALLAVAVVGPNALAGVIGLTFYSMGYLGKFFSEAFESLDLEVAKGMRQLGANRWQAFQYGLWPIVRPLIWSQSLWMLEYNIRSASIIGYVGAGGIGLQLLRYQEFGQWNRFGTVLLCILVLVVGLDLLSSYLRQKLNLQR